MKPQNERSRYVMDELQLDFGRGPVKGPFHDKSSSSRCGKRKTSSGNLPCNPMSLRWRDVKEEERLHKEECEIEDKFT